MKRKTIKVEDIKQQANHFFLNSHNELSSERKSVQHFVGNLLMSVGSYNGYGYLTQDQVPVGSTYGVDRTTEPKTFPDESRIFFY